MKRICLLLLVVILCVLSCSCSLVEVADISEQNVQFPDSSDAAGHGPELILDENGYYISGGLPEIDAFSGGQKMEYFHGEPVYDFVPSDEYGTIIPYVGKSKKYSTGSEEFDSSMIYNSMGFCTADGKIVMAASDEITSIFTYTTSDGFTYYQYVRSSEYEPMDYYGMGSTYIVPKDGSWFLELTPGSWINSTGNGVITVMKAPENLPEGTYPDADTLAIYGYDGKLINEIYGVSGYSSYENGYLVLSFKEPVENRIMTGETSGENAVMTPPANDFVPRYYYVTLQGEIVAGPYQSAETFNKFGIACVQDFDGNWRLINKDFLPINDKVYTRISKDGQWDDKDGFKYFVATSESSSSGGNSKTYNKTLYYGDGTVLGETDVADYAYFTYFDDGRIMYSFSFLDGDHYKRKFAFIDGSEIYNEEYGVSPNTYGGEPDYFVYKNFDDNSVVIMDDKGETLVVDEDYGNGYFYSDEHDLLVYSTGSVSYDYNSETGENVMNDTTVLHIYDTEQKSDLLAVNSNSSAWKCDGSDRYLIIHKYDMSNYMGDITSVSIFDVEQRKLLFEDCSNIQYMNVDGKDYFNVSKGVFSTLYDEELNVILRCVNE